MGSRVLNLGSGGGGFPTGALSAYGYLFGLTPAPPAQGRSEELLERDGQGDWRVIFRFQEGHADDVDLIDYH